MGGPGAGCAFPVAWPGALALKGAGTAIPGHQDKEERQANAQHDGGERRVPGSAMRALISAGADVFSATAFQGVARFLLVRSRRVRGDADTSLVRAILRTGFGLWRTSLVKV